MEPPYSEHLRAALRFLPPDACVSHFSALQLYGVTFTSSWPLHFSTSSKAQTKHQDIVIHRRSHHLTHRTIQALPCLGPDRTFVDCATRLGIRDLVRVGDALVASGATTPSQLVDYTTSAHIDGVVRAREAAILVTSGSESVRESDVRLMLILAGLPAPEANINIFDGPEFLARGDLVYPQWRVLVEYDGWHHERDPQQRQKDIFRRERLEAAGWTMIIVTNADLTSPVRVVARVYRALRTAGYVGSPPEYGRQWNSAVHNIA